MRSYRGDIDGLRAVAVVLVVLFHSGVTRLSGGFVGVDVFFVISGFLITSLLIGEVARTGALSIRSFYARRIRRLLPLSTLVLVATTVGCFLVLAPLARPEAAHDIRAAALWFANWHYAAESTQYMAQTDRSPVLHYWSLSVEEQFYVGWPLLILLVARASRSRHGALPLFRRRLATLLVVIVAASLATSVLLTSSSGPWAYFGVHTRAWELGAGALLALSVERVARLPRAVLALSGMAGLLLIVWSSVHLGRTVPFPGSAAVAPVAGTLLVLTAGARPSRRGVTALLGRPGPAYLGRISYGWYLWHWPCLVFAAALSGTAVDDADIAGKAPTTPLQWLIPAVLLSLLLAAMSHRLVENPIRRSALLASRVSLTHAFGVGCALLAMLAPSALLSRGDVENHPFVVLSSGNSAPAAAGRSRPGRHASGPVQTEKVVRLQMSPAQARADMTPTNPCFQQGFAPTEAPSTCTYGDQEGRRVIALIGDSHAAHWLPAMKRLAKHRGWQLWFWAKSLCAPVDVRVWLTRYNAPYNACDIWRQNVLARLAALPRLDLVILARHSGYESALVDENGQLADPRTGFALWRKGARSMFRQLQAMSQRVVVLRDVPHPRTDVPECISAHLDDLSNCAFPREARSHLDGAMAAAERAAARKLNPVPRVDLTSDICPVGPCQVVTDGGVIEFSDAHHMTRTFSRSLWRVLGKRLDRVLTG